MQDERYRLTEHRARNRVRHASRKRDQHYAVALGGLDLLFGRHEDHHRVGGHDPAAGVEQALTDAVFNLGTSWMQAGLGQSIKSGDWAAAKEHLLQYNHAGGQVLDGLTKRRQAEVSWFDHPL